ncbi:FAD-dependent oxidoreductase [Pirellulaceae bacterium SH449]
MKREAGIKKLIERTTPWDVLVIGGGATGASILLDAAARGLSVILLEKHDFGKGTSSRSTKLVHGGVRYLAQGNVSLVRDALRERTRLRNNAPHVVKEMSFLVPCRNLWQRCWYGLGFKVYDLLAGRSGFRKSRLLSRQSSLQAVPTIRPEQAAGGVLYSDGQFDDARLLINILQTAVEQGGTALNYFPVIDILKDQSGRASGVAANDSESGQTYQIHARAIINATGPFCDSLRAQDSPNAQPLVATSQGIHLVLPKEFLPGDTAVIVPKTSDGRVIFMIPWYDHVVVGTTDTPLEKPVAEPTAKKSEIEFLLATSAQYLTRVPQASDVLSLFTGIRPLVRPGGAKETKSTAAISRDHTILRSESGMVTITGGKWTTARKMAEDCIDRVIEWSSLSQSPCQTVNLPIHGAGFNLENPLAVKSSYGTDAEAIAQLAQEDQALAKPLVHGYSLCGAEVLWSIRHEMARTLEDILARRSRLLFLNAKAALQAAPAVADLMMKELQHEPQWQQQQLDDFAELVKTYQIDNQF